MQAGTFREYVLRYLALQAQCADGAADLLLDILHSIQFPRTLLKTILVITRGQRRERKQKMGYAENSLIAGEKIVYEGQVHWSVMLGPMIGAAFFGLIGLVFLMASTGTGLAFLAIGAVSAFVGIMRIKSTEMVLTNKRILLKQGILKTRTIEVLLSKIEGISVEEPLLGRVLGYGTVMIRGTGGTHEPFRNVARPAEFKRRAQTIIDSHNMAAGAKGVS
jgi:hypothetical protein